jgi:colanic acid/amylovoran biosynthesis glycosyltransferase
LTERWIWVQIAHLPPRIESTVIATRLENPDAFPGPPVRVSRFPARPGEKDWPRGMRRWIRGRLLSRAARDTGARLVHSHFGPQGWEDLAATRRHGLRQVVTFYGYDVARLPRSEPAWLGAYAELFQSVDRVLCEGPHMTRSVEQLGCPAQKLRVQRLGVELDRLPFRPRPRRAEVEPLRILMAAAFVEKKGLPYGVRAVGRLARDRAVKLTLIGDARNTRIGRAEKERILEAISAEGLERDTRMLGFQDHATLMREMGEHDVFLQPSVHAADGDCEGGAPVSLIEAAASGIPIVSTRHCDIPEVVTHERSGWLAPERDVEGLVAGLEWWTRRPDWEPTLVAARRRIEAEFDAATQGERLAAIYDELLAAAPGGAIAGGSGGGRP